MNARTILSFALPLVLFVNLEAPRANAADPVTIESISKAWQQRQNRVKTATFDWVTDLHIPEGGLDEEASFALKMLDAQARLRSKQGKAPKPGSQLAKGPVPPSAYETSFKCRLVIDHDKIRYEHSSVQWSYQKQEFVVLPYVCVLSGLGVSTIQAEGNATNSFPIGDVSQANKHPDIKDSPLRPITTTLFGCDPAKRTYVLESFHISRTFIHDGHSLVELSGKRGTLGGMEDVLWLDPERDFIPVRIACFVGGKTNLEITISYAAHVIAGWVPISWKLNLCQMVSGALERSMTSRVSSFKINDQVVSGVFDVSFPRGTYLMEQENGKYSHSIVQDDGSKRLLSEAEIGMPYAEKISSRSSPRQYMTLVLGAAIGVCCLVVLWMLRTRLRAWRRQ